MQHLLDEVNETWLGESASAELDDEIVFDVFLPDTCRTLDEHSGEWIWISWT